MLVVPACLFLFQVPNIEIDKTDKFFSHWDPDSKMFTVSSLTLLIHVFLSALLEIDKVFHWDVNFCGSFGW